MPEPRFRVLIVAAHPVQYASANFRQMARHSRFDLLVAYCSLRGAEPGIDPEFGRTVQWDVPLLDGYTWVRVPTVEPGPVENRAERIFRRAHLLNQLQARKLLDLLHRGSYPGHPIYFWH